jgi:hypothetical protein
MTQEWGRADTAGTWPRPKPTWTLALVLGALVTGVAVGGYQYHHAWTPLQRLFLSPYLRSTIAVDLGLTSGRYRLLQVVDRQGPRIPLDDEVEPVAGAAEPTFVLTPLGLNAGDVHIVWQEGRYPHTALHALLRTWIYRDQTPTALAQSAIAWTLAVFGLGLIITVPKDLARARERRHGRRLKGPELVSPARFTGRLHADGIGFLQDTRFRRRTVRIPRHLESSHLLIMGDSGTGKSTLIRQLLCQLEARGETAIVYDPALEYTPQFFSPERGDLILNPLDARSPFWSPGDELRHEAEGLTLATSLFPDRRDENPFFIEGPRRIFAHLLTFKPTPQDLLGWLTDDDELDRRVRGTPYASMIDRQAPAQRSGVLASLNMVADSLKLLPREAETAHRWSAASWAQTRAGWLFLTSMPETRTRLIPLTSVWLDMLVLRLMSVGGTPGRPVWFVLDELATLQRLPQLHTAITENRKSNNPVVLGFQGRSQLETRYGHDAEAMLSQPATKIFLRTSEPRAAKWVSETIGEIEIERLRESRSAGRWDQRNQQNYGLERQVEPLVMPSEITGLAALHGYMKVGNLVTRLHVPFMDLPHRHPLFVPRSMPAARAIVTAAPAPDPHDGPAQRLTPNLPGHSNTFFR